VNLDFPQVLKFVQICVSCHALVAVAFEVLVFVMAGSENHASHKYYVKNQQDATLAVLFISYCKITLHVLYIIQSYDARKLKHKIRTSIL